MKRIFAVLLAALLAAALAVPALADLIWEPLEDSFFLTHRDDCIYVEDWYEAQRDADVFVSPEDQTAQSTLTAGTTVYVGYIWVDGAVWGKVGNRNEDGWIRLDSFRRLYDAEDFEKEHGAGFADSDGSITVSPETETVLWTFPGSGEAAGTVGGTDEWEEETVALYRLWTDGDGNDWGEIAYFYGLSGWVYLPDPADGTLTRTAPRYADEAVLPPEPEQEAPITETPEPGSPEPTGETPSEAAEAPEPTEEAPQETPQPRPKADDTNLRKLASVVIAVAAVAAAAVILIVGLGRKSG